MSQIIQLTAFSGYDGAKQLADHDVRRCNSVIYCKSQAEATCYRAIIEFFGKGRRGVDHLKGIIAICVDPASTMIEGMHLISQKIPSYIKSSYPFQLQAKKIGEEKLANFLEVCGLTTEKELKAVWERCANRLTFPIEIEADEREDYISMVNTANSIIQENINRKNKKYIDEVKHADDEIEKWLSGKFGDKFLVITTNFSWRKTWKVSHSIDNYFYEFSIDMNYSPTMGINSFRVCFESFSTYLTFLWSQDKNMTAVISRFNMMWEQFSTMMVAMTKARNAATAKLTVV